MSLTQQVLPLLWRLKPDMEKGRAGYKPLWKKAGPGVLMSSAFIRLLFICWFVYKAVHILTVKVLGGVKRLIQK